MSSKLSKKEQFCLEFLAGRSSASWDICVSARDAGLNKARCRYEWADAPLRSLRARGFAKRNGERDQFGRSVHEVTDKGLVFLATGEV